MISDPVAAQGKKTVDTIYDKNEEQERSLKHKVNLCLRRFQAPDQNITDKITPLEDAGMDAESTEESIERKKLDEEMN